MSQNGPTGLEALPRGWFSPPGPPASCRPRLAEHARLEWRLDDGGDPAALIEDFLTAEGLPARHALVA